MDEDLGFDPGIGLPSTEGFFPPHTAAGKARRVCFQHCQNQVGS